MRNRIFVLAAVAISAACTSSREPPAPEAGRSARFVLTANAIPDRYIVVLNDDAGSVPGVAGELATRHGGALGHVYEHALKGFSVTLPRARALALADDPRVRWVEEDAPVHAAGVVQSNATWGLDRLDQRSLPLDLGYTSGATGVGVTVYVLDTGIRTTHAEFGGRASKGHDAIGGGGDGDCNGHGTHVAGTIGGATRGVARGVSLVAVRVLDCAGVGTMSDAIEGVDWVTGNHVARSVLDLSLAGGTSTGLDGAVQAAIASGVTVVAPAGNDGANACSHSPARVPAAITVGATTSADGIAPFSDQGPCVDLFAPGDSVTSAWNASDTASETASGTSMAAPHVAGAAALYLESNPTATPALVAQALTGNATPGLLTGLDVGSPNLLLYTGFVTGDPLDAVAPTAELTSPAADSSLSGTVAVSADASDDVGVSQVIFLVDDTYLSSDTTAPYEAVWSTVLAENGAHTLVARAYDVGGNMTDSAPVEVTVQNSGFAVWDAARGAPACTAVSPACRTGQLTLGRDQLGPEPSTPNTLGATCADGGSGVFHVDESVDSVSIATVDGTNLAVGKPVRIDVRVWSYSNYKADHLDLYAAADAASPAWTLLGTIESPAAGAQVFTFRYSLPAGPLQAIRANFRYLGAPGACTAGAFDDRDDLVFAVGPGAPDITSPTVSVTAPVGGATIQGPVTVTASASDDGAVDRVEFLAGGVVFATVRGAPYSATFAPTVPGTYLLSARAVDYAGLVGNSAAVAVTLADVVAPTVSLNSPPDGAALRGTAALVASATDAAGIKSVEFLVDGAVVASAAAAPWQGSWDTATAAAGSHTLSAKAYDVNGNSTVSAVADVTVDNTAPVASITSPAGGATFSSEVPVVVSVSDSGTITRVELYADGALVGADLSAPWSVTWATGTATGPASLVARATDAAGNVGTSPAVAVVIEDVAAPLVAVSAPLAGAYLRGTTSVTAAASDDIGVVKVDFFVDGVLLQSDTASPWSVDWDTAGLSSGTRLLSAEAFDAAGNSTASAQVSVVVDNIAPTAALTPPPGASLAGVKTLTASATDDVAVARVDFFVGTALVASDPIAPYTAEWDTTRVPDGSYTVHARSVDHAGNSADSAGVTVTVANPIPETATYFALLRVPGCGAGSAGCFSGELLDGRGPVGPESGAPNTIGESCADGPAGTYHVDESLDSLMVATLDGQRLAPGKVVRITATAWIYSAASNRLDLYHAPDASSPEWTEIITLTPSGTGLVSMETSFTLPAGGSLQAIRGVLRYGGTKTSCGAGAYGDQDDLVFATTVDAVAPAAALTAPSAGAIVGGTRELTADANDDVGGVGAGVGVARVDFYASSALIGSTPQLIGSDVAPPYSVTWSTATLVNGSYSLSARAVDLAGNSRDSAPVTVTVSNSVLQSEAAAAYDPVFKAPRCSEVAIGCTTGALVNGRGPVGPEPSQPNTIDAGCADGTAGTFHVDESLDSLTISTADPLGLAPGRSVLIEAEVWVYKDRDVGNVIFDRLDLFHAPDASSPVWTLIETIAPTATGLQTLSTTWTLPEGGTRLQAIRGVFRYGGTAAACVPGSYNDHDDLIFAATP